MVLHGVISTSRSYSSGVGMCTSSTLASRHCSQMCFTSLTYDECATYISCSISQGSAHLDTV